MIKFSVFRSLLSALSFELSALSSQLSALSFLLLFPFLSVAQQSLTYTQYMNDLTVYNPAYPLINGQAGVNLMGRMQWVGIDGAPRSFALNSNLAFENKAAAGLIIIQDKFTVENQTEEGIFYAKSVQLAESSFLALSLNAGFQSYKANYSQLDPSDPEFREDINRTSALTGAGLMLYNPDRFYIGVSLPRLVIRGAGTAPGRINPKNTCYLSAGFLQEIDDDITFKPATLISYSEKLSVMADISGTLYIDALGIGLNYRTTREVAGIFSYTLDNFRAGYSYQTGFSNRSVGNLSNGTHELTLGFRFGRSPGKGKL